MKLQNLTVIFIIIILPIILIVSLYISTGLKTIRYQALYDTGLLTATQDAVKAFETNTLNNKYFDNPEPKRSIIKSSVKMFEKSLCNTCNISSYNTNEIEEYIPAIVFGMYDGFYMYTPSHNPKTEKYEHSLKNYVYYSEILDETNGVIITYSLDSYVQISGYFKNRTTGELDYCSKEGYLINTNETRFNGKSTLDEVNKFYALYRIALENGTNPSGTIEYYGIKIDIRDTEAVEYFVDNYVFSDWFNSTVIPNIDTEHSYLSIDEENDPEDPKSEFVQHKNKIIKQKIEGVLNSTITAYSERTWGQNYKMPKLSETDWEKIYSDISITTFFQGKKIGFTKYNGYCVLNSNNHSEFVNPNLLHFSTDDNNNKEINTNKDYYHDIRCEKIPSDFEESSTRITTLRGWRIGKFQKKTIKETDPTGKTRYKYEYYRKECACYYCINGSINNKLSVYDYISAKDGVADDFIKNSYWTSLARERYEIKNYIINT